MDDRTEHLVHFWIVPLRHMPWSWDERGEALRWGSSTIAMRGEIEELVQGLAPGGLPPFGAIALVLAACRDSWSAESPVQFTALEHLLTRGEGGSEGVVAILKRVRERLDLIADLPQARRSTTSAKLAMLISVRDRAGPAHKPDSARTIAGAIASGIPNRLLQGHPAGSSRAHLAGILDCLDRGLDAVQPEQLDLVERTGLDGLPDPVDIDAASIRALLAGAACDRELGGVVALANRLLAAVHLPRPLADPDDLPMGGISDLSHRGSPDRLLVGELAHDDLVLAVRIATGEALYLRREAPPRSPISVRSILIDTGIRMWGLPRVFAVAVALAMAAGAPSGTRVHVWRAAGAGMAPVRLADRDGLIAFLGELAPEAHPGAALAAWRDALAVRPGSEAVCITHPRVLADAGFREALTAASLGPCHAACVDATGAYRLLAGTDGLWRELQSAALDLDVLVRAPGGRTRLRREVVDAPLVYEQDPYPFTVPHAVDLTRAVDLGDRGVLSATADGRLTLWAPSALGPRQLTDALPSGEVVWIGADANTGYVLVHQRQEQQWTLAAAPLGGGGCESADLLLPGTPQWIGLSNDALVVVWRRQAQAFRLDTGARIAQLDLPEDATLRQTRFLVSPAGWHAVAWDGQTLMLVEVCKAGKLDAQGHLSFAFFDRAGTAGPWGFTAAGDCIDMSEGDEKATGLPTGCYRFLRASRDGHQLLVAAADHVRWRIDLLHGRSWAMRGAGKQAAHHDRGVVLDVGVHRLSGHLSDALHAPLRVLRLDGRLSIITRNRHLLRLELSGHHIAWVPCTMPQRPEGGMAFEAASDGAQHWRNAAAHGSRFRCDVRGLLILDRPERRDRPEIVIVLRRGQTALWCSDGRRYGPSGLLIDAPRVDGQAAQALLALVASYAGDLP